MTDYERWIYQKWGWDLVEEVGKIVDKTFSDNDLIRFYQKNLTAPERRVVREFFEKEITWLSTIYHNWEHSDFSVTLWDMIWETVQVCYEIGDIIFNIGTGHLIDATLQLADLYPRAEKLKHNWITFYQRLHRVKINPIDVPWWGYGFDDWYIGEVLKEEYPWWSF